jgi:hypothetical protein
MPLQEVFAEAKEPFGQSSHLGWCGTIRHVNFKAELRVSRAAPRLPKAHLNVVYRVRFAQRCPEFVQFMVQGFSFLPVPNEGCGGSFLLSFGRHIYLWYLISVNNHYRIDGEGVVPPQVGNCGCLAPELAAVSSLLGIPTPVVSLTTRYPALFPFQASAFSI